MSHRGKGVPHIGKFCIPNNSLWFVLSFKPLNGVLAPPVVRKHNFVFFFQNFQLQTPLTRKILLTQRNDLYRRVPLVEYYQNPLTRVHLIFWNKTPPSTSFRECSIPNGISFFISLQKFLFSNGAKKIDIIAKN